MTVLIYRDPYRSVFTFNKTIYSPSPLCGTYVVLRNLLELQLNYDSLNLKDQEKYL